MDCYFQHQISDNGPQSSTRTLYLNLYWSIEQASCQYTKAEQQVAKRKLMESMDAMMRALSL